MRFNLIYWPACQHQPKQHCSEALKKLEKVPFFIGTPVNTSFQPKCRAPSRWEGWAYCDVVALAPGFLKARVRSQTPVPQIQFVALLVRAALTEGRRSKSGAQPSSCCRPRAPWGQGAAAATGAGQSIAVCSWRGESHRAWSRW